VSRAVLVTGAAGFIGYHVAQALLARGETVLGIDNLNAYYDPALKEARLARLGSRTGFGFERIDLADRAAVAALFARHDIGRVVHLAAQAGVRYSLTNPHAYIETNVAGFLNLLEPVRTHPVAHFVYASSSSVYGANEKMPFAVADRVDRPVSLYAATKRANELMAHTYAHLYRLPLTGLRFFTVYGPWGRPDMALFKFTRAILEGAPIPVFNQGKMVRDFTYIDDIVEGVVRVLDRPATPCERFDAASPDPATSNAPYRVFNIGNHTPVPLLEFIACLEDALGRRAERRLLPLQDGDVPATCADVDALERWAGFAPATDIRTGIARFVDWYRSYYGV
jgi:UDP-glucuronate 4-epimerase